MIRKFKGVGIALVAVFAMSAVAASAAQAAEFHSSLSQTIVNASQTTTHEFTVGSGFGSITCSTATFQGESNKEVSSELEITPTYSGCTDSLGREAMVNTGTATYLFHSSGTVDLKGSITIEVTNSSKEVKCKVTVAEQAGINGISYANEGTSDVKVTANSTNVKTTTSGGLLNCGVSNGEHTGGTYTGVSVASGEGPNGEPATLRYE